MPQVTERTAWLFNGKLVEEMSHAELFAAFDILAQHYQILLSNEATHKLRNEPENTVASKGAAYKDRA